MKATTKKVGIGVGVAAAAAAAAGAYWLYGAKDAKKHRKLAKSWMLKARADVMEQLEKLEHIDKTQYMDIVDTVVRTYGAAKGVSTEEIGKLARDLKQSWQHVKEESSAPARRAARKVHKRAAKKK